MTEPARSPLSYPVNVARLPQRGMQVRIDADAEQRAALAAIHSLEGVESLQADLLAAPWKRNGVRVSGSVSATVDQLCVVSLEPMRNEMKEEIDMVFLPQDSKLGREGFGQGGEIVLDFDGDDSPETFSGDWIDVGALAEEFFGLGIDPYPHKAEPAAPAADHEPKEASLLAEKLRAALDRAGKAK